MRAEPLHFDDALRPVVPVAYLPSRETIDFQITDYSEISTNVPVMETYSHETLTCNAPLYKRKAPEKFSKSDNHHIVLFGRTQKGYSVAVSVKTHPTMTLQVLGPGDAAFPREAENTAAISRFVERLSRHEKVKLASHRVQHMNDVGGFHPDVEAATPTMKKFPFLQLAFTCMSDLWATRKLLVARNENAQGRDSKMKLGPKSVTLGGEEFRVEVHETFVPPVLQLLQESGLTPSSVVSLRLDRATRCSRRATHCDLEFSARALPFGANHPLQPLAAAAAGSGIYPILIHAFDIETMTLDPHDPRAKVIAIAATTQNMKTGERQQVVHGLRGYTNSFPKADRVLCFTYESELELCEGWRDRLVLSDDADVLTHYNGDKFDFYYLHVRVTALNPNSRFFFFGRLTCVPCEFSEEKFESKAHGSKTTQTYKVIPGRVNFDLCTYMQRSQHRFTCYKLKFVCDALAVGSNKDDLPIDVMQSHWRSQDPDLCFLVMKYCLQDTALLILLLEHQKILFTEIEMSRVCSVMLADLFNRGQMFKVLSLVYIYARRNNSVLTNLFTIDALGYQGATVLQAAVGFYADSAVLDFASLYPSIMRAYNLCTSTIVAPRDMERYGNLPGYTYFEKATDIGTYRFQQTLTGILPNLLKHLLGARKKAKADMKACGKVGDAVGKELANGRQLALKISCNSVYGFLGAKTGKYTCLPIAATVTAVGRELIQRSIDVAEASAIPRTVAAQSEFLEDGATERAEDSHAVVVYGDTDSIFVEIRGGPQEAGQRKAFLFRVGIELGEEVTAALRRTIMESLGVGPERAEAIDLEFEKIYLNLLLLSKKCYTGLKFENLDDEGKVEAKGAAQVRRDFCWWVRDALTAMADAITKRRELEGATQQLSDAIHALVNSQIPLDKMVVTCKLAAEYKRPDSEVQVNVARRVRERILRKELARHTDPDEVRRLTAAFLEAKKAKFDASLVGPQTGDRVAYVIVYNPASQKLCDKGEDPEYVRENNVPLDLEYYIESLRSPVFKTFAVLGPRLCQRMHDTFEHFLGIVRRRRAQTGSLLDAWGAAPETDAGGSLPPSVFSPDSRIRQYRVKAKRKIAAKAEAGSGNIGGFFISSEEPPAKRAKRELPLVPQKKEKKKPELATRDIKRLFAAAPAKRKKKPRPEVDASPPVSDTNCVPVSREEDVVRATCERAVSTALCLETRKQKDLGVSGDKEKRKEAKKSKKRKKSKKEEDGVAKKLKKKKKRRKEGGGVDQKPKRKQRATECRKRKSVDDAPVASKKQKTGHRTIDSFFRI
jgi:DNA polymerase delta subunit 1